MKSTRRLLLILAALCLSISVFAAIAECSMVATRLWLPWLFLHPGLMVAFDAAIFFLMVAIAIHRHAGSPVSSERMRQKRRRASGPFKF